MLLHMYETPYIKAGGAEEAKTFLFRIPVKVPNGMESAMVSFFLLISIQCT